MELIIGIIGAGLALAAFLLNQFNIWKNSDVRYDLLNVASSVALIFYALLLESWPFLILNFVWGAVSLKDVVKYYLGNKN